jgi:hypothetical protein
MFNWFRKPKNVGKHPAGNTKMFAPEEVYRNPIDNKAYVAPGGWTKHEPAQPKTDDPQRKVKLDNVRLLTSETDLAARTSVKELADFVREAERLAEDSFGSSVRQFRVMAQFSCKPTGREVKLAHQGDASIELIRAYYLALTGANDLIVKDGEVVFQIEFSIRP